MILIEANVTDTAITTQQKLDALQAFVMRHVVDSDQWLLPLFKGPVNLPGFVTLHGLMVGLAAVFLLLAVGLGYRRKQAVPTGWTNVLEAFVLFIRNDIAIEFLGEKDGRRMAPIFCSFFFFVLMMNLMGLFPALAAPTGNVSVTGAMGLTTLGFMIVGGMIKNGPLGFFKAFVPQGAPWPILFILAPLEFVGMFVRIFALMIRLFVNMLAGHVVIFFLLGMIAVFGPWGLPMFAMAVLICLLEIFICFLQAYIFTLLSAMFIGQAWRQRH
ncbi:MAG: F0F1 ATP synthase subunit A [Verrucomicrobiota bacterium]|nr:F0F1 ATP synthase subunit A [Verrucomicrobiota bacterium]